MLIFIWPNDTSAAKRVSLMPNCQGSTYTPLIHECVLVLQDARAHKNKTILLWMSKEKHLQTRGKMHQTGTLFCFCCPTPTPNHEMWAVNLIEGNYEWQLKEVLTPVDMNIGCDPPWIYFCVWYKLVIKFHFFFYM